MKAFCPFLSLMALLCALATLHGAEPPRDKEYEALIVLPVPELRAAAEKGNAKAQFVLCDRYECGNGVEKDEKEGVKWLRKAAEAGLAEAQGYLGNCYVRGRGVVKNEKEGGKWYRKAAEQGDALAQSALGDCYQFGNGVVKDEVEAYKWYLLGGARGDKDAQRGSKRLERKLTPQERKEGEKRAAEWEAQFKAKRKGAKP